MQRWMVQAWLVVFAGAVAAAQAPAPATAPRELASPQATMLTFLAAIGEAGNRSGAAQAEAYGRALATMDFSAADAEILPRRERARMLLGILDRLGTVRPEELPDGAQVAREGLSRFTYFPRFPAHDWVWKEVEGGPAGRIELALQPDGRWLFSRPTVAGLEPLYRSLIKLPARHAATNQMADAVAPTWERTSWRGWLGLLAAIFAGVAVGKIIASTLGGVARRLEKRQWLARATLFRNLASPASLAVLGLGLAVGLQFIHLEAALLTFLLKIIQFLYILALGWLLYNLVDIIDLYLRQLTARTESKLDDMLVPLIRKTLRIFLVLVFTLVVAQNVFGLNITGWLAGLGIAGLAVSLAAQDSIKNLFGSITVFFDQPFVVGDFISFDGQEAVVQEIGFRSTKMRTLDGHLVTVPNMKFTDNSVRNISARPAIRRVLDVAITYDTPPAKVEEAIRILKDLLAEPSIAEVFDLAEQPPRVAFHDFGAASLNLRVMYWYQLRDGRDYFSYLAHAEQFNLRLFRAYGEAGIEFAFPTQTLYLAGDPRRPLPAGAAR